MAVHQQGHDSVSGSSVDNHTPVLKVDMTAATKNDNAVVDRDVPDTPPLPQKQLAWSKVRSSWQDAFSEFLGTMVLILFGDGVVAQVVLSKGTKGDYQSISWGWG